MDRLHGFLSTTHSSFLNINKRPSEGELEDGEPDASPIVM